VNQVTWQVAAKLDKKFSAASKLQKYILSINFFFPPDGAGKGNCVLTAALRKRNRIISYFWTVPTFNMAKTKSLYRERIAFSQHRACTARCLPSEEMWRFKKPCLQPSQSAQALPRGYCVLLPQKHSRRGPYLPPDLTATRRITQGINASALGVPESLKGDDQAVLLVLNEI